MTEAWLQVGAPVLVASGLFQDLEGVVDRIDPSADVVVVKLEIFGRPVPLTFPLSAAGEHFTPFGNRPSILSCPHADIRRDHLLAECPDAEAIYQTDCWRSTIHAFVQVSRTGSGHRLSVRGFDLAWPIRDKMVWATTEVTLTEAEWTSFTGLIEQCRFWQLAYDDGRRFSRKGKRWHWSLEGYEGGKYHAVVRSTSEPKSEISACCECLCALAEIERPAGS